MTMMKTLEEMTIEELEVRMHNIDAQVEISEKVQGRYLLYRGELEMNHYNKIQDLISERQLLFKRKYELQYMTV